MRDRYRDQQRKHYKPRPPRHFAIPLSSRRPGFTVTPREAPPHITGAATIAKLHSNAEFLADIKAARKEVKPRSKGYLGMLFGCAPATASRAATVAYSLAKPSRHRQY
ncbi:hypothetical protein YH63_015765 [Afipia massiliensis]|uniref:Uncharacterized protein n=1 Tax=Afipia massiliensis TaxID=211460 RepID=A0A4V6BFC5_9BRAD|nr:hypothetical protein [Afipia massiliensis]TKT72763.1 hypothetical protein YH63_015765 [Afipia massiliensis]